MKHQDHRPSLWDVILDSLLEELVLVLTQDTVLLANDAARRALALAPPGDTFPLWQQFPWLNRHVQRVRSTGHAAYVSGPFQAQHLAQWCLRPVHEGATEPKVLLVGRIVPTQLDFLPMTPTARHILLHDVQTPLTSILGYCEILLRGELGPLTPEQEQALEHMHQSITTLRHLIVQAMEEERPPNGECPRERLDLVQIIRQVAVEMSSLARQQGLSIHLVIPATAVPVYVNRLHIQQVLYNLLSNAIKYTPAGGRITVTVEHTPEESTVKVQDTGPGITWRDFQVISRPFERGENSQGQKDGSGLGLFIVQLIVAAHGGVFWAEPRPEAGSTFAFSLPTVTAYERATTV